MGVRLLNLLVDLHHFETPKDREALIFANRTAFTLTFPFAF